ncbi:MAG: hypothetical protein ACFE0I_08975 [Elainellaceae cyanobacterium]
MQRLQKTSNWVQAVSVNPLPYRVSWIAPPIALNQLNLFHKTDRPSLPPPTLSPERLATPSLTSTTVTIRVS